MARDREDFMVDYDPRWGNDNERDYEDDDREQADCPEFEDSDLCKEHGTWKPYCPKAECPDCHEYVPLHTDHYDDGVRCDDCAGHHERGDPDATAEKRQMGIE